MKAFEVLHPGVLTTIQDFGRKGFMKYGTPASGVADRFSAETANLLAGNDPGAALLEITLFRLELLALTDLSIAVTGGNLTPDDQPGSFAHVAVRDRSNRGSPRLSREGKWDFGPIWRFRVVFPGERYLNSRSVFVRGLMGQPLQAKAILEIEEAATPIFGSGYCHRRWFPIIPKGSLCA